MTRIRVIDSHTGGEPTRVVVGGFPELEGRNPGERRKDFRERFDHLRRALVCEPRGTEGMVGALLLEPENEHAVAGVIYFNNAGYLGMCGHGTIGLVRTLWDMGRIEPGDHVLETPVGEIPVTLHPDGRVSLTNVRSYRFRKDVRVEVEGLGEVIGDVAYGGNWFFLTPWASPIGLDQADELLSVTKRIRKALAGAGITGENGAEIDHVELFAPAKTPGLNAQNFVLCPGGAYDRSPCGTGTSAKVACLADDGKLKEGEVWRQQSITGSVFEATYTKTSHGVRPTITGVAYLTGEMTVTIDPDDPFAFGI